MLVFSTSQTIFLVDDDPDDRIFMNDLFLKIKWNENLMLFDSGEKMLEYLAGLEEVYYPALIILDYHMPQLRGEDILKVLKMNESYRQIPVVVYSSEMYFSLEQKLIQMGAAGCYKKADGYLAGIQLAKTLKLLAAPCDY